MSFLDSDIVKKEIDECNFLRELSTEMEIVATETQNKDIIVDYYHTLYALLDKQQTIYQRLCLIANEDHDYQAKILKLKIESELKLQGMPITENVIQYIEEKKLQVRSDIIDLTGEDLDLPVDLY